MKNTERRDLENTCGGLNSGDPVMRFGPGELFMPLELKPDQRSMFHAILSLSRNVLFLAREKFVSGSFDGPSGTIRGVDSERSAEKAPDPRR
jgi:hypothetical protein